MNDKLRALAVDLSYASSVKEAARLRSQCTLDEWKLVLAEAKRVYNEKRREQAAHRDAVQTRLRAQASYRA